MLTLLALGCSRTDAPTFTGPDSGDPGSDPTGSGAIGAGELVITEIMPDTAAVDGDFGEWFEVTSVAARDLDLEGLTFEDDDGEGFTVAGSLALAVGGRVVFGASDNLGINGGVPVDYAYDIGAVKLGNEGDTVAILLGAIPIDAVAYEAVSWGVEEGSSLSLDPSATDAVANDSLTNWCLGRSAYGLGDLGTPREPNEGC